MSHNESQAIRKQLILEMGSVECDDTIKTLIDYIDEVYRDIRIKITHQAGAREIFMQVSLVYPTTIVISTETINCRDFNRKGRDIVNLVEKARKQYSNIKCDIDLMPIPDNIEFSSGVRMDSVSFIGYCRILDPKYSVFMPTTSSTNLVVFCISERLVVVNADENTYAHVNGQRHSHYIQNHSPIPNSPSLFTSLKAITEMIRTIKCNK